MGFGFSGAGGGGIPSTLISSDTDYYIATTGDDANDGSIGSPWATLYQAFVFLADKTIATDAIVTINVADGTYTMATALNISQANGDRVSIIGNPTTEANVILDFTSNTNGIVLANNNALGSINGFTIRGTWIDDGTGIDLVGILVTQNSSIQLGANVTITKFYFGIKTDLGGSAFADSCVITNGGGAGFFALNGGTIEANNANASAISDTANGLGSGFLAEVGGTIRGDSFTATTCRHSGVNSTGGAIECDTLSSDSNIGTGIYIDRGGNIKTQGPSTADSNGSAGVWMIRQGIFSSFSTLSISSNSSYGILLLESTARLNGTVTANTNALHNVFVSQGSHCFLKFGSSFNNSVGGAGISVTDNSNCQTGATSTATGNATWGIQCELGSSVTAQTITLTGNSSGETSIPVDVMAADGAYIRRLSPPGGSGFFSLDDKITVNTTIYIATTGNDTTGDGTSGAPWLTLARAFDSLKDQIIATDVTVTIDIADGTYVSTVENSIDHPNGDRISIVGNAGVEANVVLHYNKTTGGGTNGLTISDGNRFGSINGVTIRGAYVDTSVANGRSGILVTKNASVTLGANVTIDKFYYGVTADWGGFVFADSCAITNGGLAAFWANQGGIIQVDNATATTMIVTSLNRGTGFLATLGGQIKGDTFVATSCNWAGAIAEEGGLIHCDDFTVTFTNRYGILVDNATIISEQTISLEDNSDRGLYVVNGGKFLGQQGEISRNGGEGIHVHQSSQVRFTGGVDLTTNTRDNILVAEGSRLMLGSGATSNSSTNGSGIRVTEGSYADVPSCTFNNNGQWGLECDLSSFIEGTSTTKTGNTSGATSITVNTLSSDGSYIKA